MGPNSAANSLPTTQNRLLIGRSDIAKPRKSRSFSAPVRFPSAQRKFSLLSGKTSDVGRPESGRSKGYSPTRVRTSERVCGVARCSSRKMPCQTPSCIRPSVTGMVSWVWVSALLMCAGMSSGPSSLWR